MKDLTRDTILGLVFFGAIAILGYFTIYLTEFSFAEKQSFRVRFTAAEGLKAGDPVLVLGSRAGKVTAVAYDDQASDQYRVIATLQLDRPITLREKFKIQIEESSFLGGRIATIDPGDALGKAIEPGTILTGTIESSPLGELGKLVQENREDVREFVASVRRMAEKTEKGEGSLGKLINDDSLYTNFKDTFENAKQITNDIKEGKGTFGRLFADETLANNISATVTNLGDISRDLKSGKGTMGRLFTDESLYNNWNEIAVDLRAGKGTLGKLLNDEETASDVKATMKNFREISDKLVSGEGTLGKLVNESALYDDLSAGVKDLREIVADAKAGKGTLGKLLNDDSLYADIQRTFKSLNRSIEDGREAAPIGTFTALLFSSF